MRLLPTTEEYLTTPLFEVAAAHPFATRPIPPLSPYATAPLPGPGSVSEPLVSLDAPITNVALYDGNRLPRGRYPSLLREQAALRLQQAAALLPDGFGLAVLDGWRSRAFQQQLVDYYGSAATEAGFVSSTAIAAFTPPHVTGGAVDITLDAGAGPLALGTDFDSFEPAAGVAALEGLDGPDAVLRRVLYWSLVSAGFAPYAQEWWHYSYGDQNWAIFTSQPQARYGEATEFDGPVVR
jgi:D-alanyl-D-alanine dipeptidase